MKKIAKAFIVAILGWQVRRLQKLNSFKTIAVVGGIGKTSTKFAIANTLSSSLRVRFQEGNYNDIVSVPLVFFDKPMPSLLNPLAWLKLLVSNEKQINSNYPFDVVVLEIGTDGPNQIKEFGRYLNLDLTVVTAIVPEHMVYFKDLDQVASEELSVAKFSKQLLINTDLCPEKYLKKLDGYKTYAKNKPANYKIKDFSFKENKVSLYIDKDSKDWLKVTHDSFSELQLYSLASASAVADVLGIDKTRIKEGLARVGSVAGRMQRLNGISGSLIIDDSYNASPDAMKAALETLYRLDAPQKIALLGNMNELGKLSAEAHIEIGKLCDPKKLDVVVTLGNNANKYLAEVAEKNGCKVFRTTSPYEAGEKIAEMIHHGAVILVKGSQNGVFAEEAIKSMLKTRADVSKLVRQSESWMSIKQKQFKQGANI